MDNLLQQLGLEALTAEEKDWVLIQITDSLLKRLILRVYDRLNENDQKEFDRLTGTNDTQKIEAFLAAKISDLNEIRDEELEGLVDEMKDFLSSAKK